MKIRQEVIVELGNLLNHLESNSIDYIVSGSLAMNSYMVPRFTRDIDIVIDLKEESLQKFAEYFTSGFYLHKSDMRKQVENKGMFNAISMATGYKYDFIVQKNVEYEKLKFERKKRLQVFEIPAWVISLEDLIISKLNWMQNTESIMQKNDIIALLEEHPDIQYIMKWINVLELKTFDLL